MRVTVLAVALSLACLTGCSRISTHAVTGVPSSNPWTIPGVLRIGDTRVPDNLNRMLGTLTVDNELGNLWCAHLLIVDDRETLQPELALAEPTLGNRGISADGKTIVYNLRPQARWQDGVPFGAADVIFSWQQVMNPKNLVQSRDFYEAIERIDMPDPHTIIVRLKKPQAGFIENFFTDYCVLPKHLLGGMESINHAEYNRLPIGTGPFRVAQYQPGVFIKFVANPQYWRGPPKLREIDYHIIPDANTLLTQMRTHELDFYRNVPAEQAMQLSGIPHTTVYRYPYSQYFDIGFNAARDPVSDKRVRQAIAYATDVPALIRDATHGEHMPADSDQPPWRWSHDDAVKRYPHDISKAAALLDAAGWHVGADGMRTKNGKPLQLAMVGLANDATALRSETMIQQQWRMVGIDVQIRNFPANVLYALGSGVEQSGNFDVSFEGWNELLDPDNVQLYGCRMAPPNGWNIYHYCSPVVDRAEIVARGSYDRATRKVAYDRIQEAITDELPFYVLWFVRQRDLANSDMRGYRPARSLSALWNPWEWSI